MPHCDTTKLIGVIFSAKPTDIAIYEYRYIIYISRASELVRLVKVQNIPKVQETDYYIGTPFYNPIVMSRIPTLDQLLLLGLDGYHFISELSFGYHFISELFYFVSAAYSHDDFYNSRMYNFLPLVNYIYANFILADQYNMVAVINFLENLPT